MNEIQNTLKICILDWFILKSINHVAHKYKNNLFIN